MIQENKDSYFVERIPSSNFVQRYGSRGKKYSSNRKDGLVYLREIKET